MAACALPCFRGAFYNTNNPITVRNIPKTNIYNSNSRKILTVKCTLSSSPSPQVENALSKAPEAEYTPSESTASMNFMTGAVNALFSFQPFFRFAAGKAREMIKKRGEAIGHPWEPELERLSEHDWEEEIRTVENEAMAYPDYYRKPFHAYEKGNLTWNAALELELAEKSVHSTVFDPLAKSMDVNGDANLRKNYHDKMKTMMDIKPKTILDIGCGSGTSTFALHEAFPEASLVGVDLSPYFLSVCNYRLRKRRQEEEEEDASGMDDTLNIRFVHAKGEETGFPSSSFDLVSICLVCHELPRSATKKIIEEAHRVLKPNGYFCIMEMNPHSPFLQKMVNNVFAFTAFKATEPYFDDYRTFPIEEAIAARGFEFPRQAENSPRHRTIVAKKV